MSSKKRDRETYVEFEYDGHELQMMVEDMTHVI